VSIRRLRFACPPHADEAAVSFALFAAKAALPYLDYVRSLSAKQGVYNSKT